MRQRYRQYNLATENRNPFLGVITLKKQNLTANERKHVSLDKAETALFRNKMGKRFLPRDKAQNSPVLLQTNANILSVQKKIK